MHSLRYYYPVVKQLTTILNTRKRPSLRFSVKLMNGYKTSGRYAVTASSDTQSTLGQDVSSSLANSNQNTNTQSTSSASSSIILGRRLIYSHHIISKTKRADMRNLASHYKLTGYVKIGWPGIVILEGRDEDQCLYDEMKEVSGGTETGKGTAVVDNSNSVDLKRLFPTLKRTICPSLQTLSEVDRISSTSLKVRQRWLKKWQRR
jgi:hypothetical protein